MPTSEIICSTFEPLEAHYTEGEVALALGISSAILRKWRANGHGPTFLKLAPGLYRYPKSELLQWMAQRRGREIAAEATLVEEARP